MVIPSEVEGPSPTTQLGNPTPIALRPNFLQPLERSKVTDQKGAHDVQQQTRVDSPNQTHPEALEGRAVSPQRPTRRDPVPSALHR